MAEPKPMKEDRRAALINELEWSRAELARNVREVHGDLDVAARFRHSVAQSKTAWLGGAALAGWVLSRLSRRKKKPQSPSDHPESGWIQKQGRAGLFLALLNALFTLFKPVITTFATRKIGQLAARSDPGSGRGGRRF